MNLLASLLLDTPLIVSSFCSVALLHHVLLLILVLLLLPLLLLVLVLTLFASRAWSASSEFLLRSSFASLVRVLLVLLQKQVIHVPFFLCGYSLKLFFVHSRSPFLFSFDVA